MRRRSGTLAAPLAVRISTRAEADWRFQFGWADSGGTGKNERQSGGLWRRLSDALRRRQRAADLAQNQVARSLLRRPGDGGGALTPMRGCARPPRRGASSEPRGGGDRPENRRGIATPPTRVAAHDRREGAEALRGRRQGRRRANPLARQERPAGAPSRELARKQAARAKRGTGSRPSRAAGGGPRASGGGAGTGTRAKLGVRRGVAARRGAAAKRGGKAAKRPGGAAPSRAAGRGGGSGTAASSPKHRQERGARIGAPACIKRSF